MKKGNIRMIYEDPVTMTKPEGRAELLKLVKADKKIEIWKVKFIDDEIYDPIVTRRIKI